jgi:hypothetical protein
MARIDRAGEPRPEVQPGERLVVIRWADHDESDDALSSAPPEAGLASYGTGERGCGAG